MENRYCPKCKSLVTEVEAFEGARIYHCWGCGLRGTHAEMVRTTLTVARRNYENASKLTCHFCREKKAIWYDLFPTLIINGGPASVPACKDCRPEVAQYLLPVPVGLIEQEVLPARISTTARTGA
jgi:hypothetical protein